MLLNILGYTYDTGQFGLHNSLSTILFVTDLYKNSNELIQLWVQNSSSPNTTNALITTLVLAFHQLDIFPSPISLNGESERKCSEVFPITALRKDLEVMKTL